MDLAILISCVGIAGNLLYKRAQNHAALLYVFWGTFVLLFFVINIIPSCVLNTAPKVVRKTNFLEFLRYFCIHKDWKDTTMAEQHLKSSLLASSKPIFIHTLHWKIEVTKALLHLGSQFLGRLRSEAFNNCTFNSYIKCSFMFIYYFISAGNKSILRP